MELRCPGCNAVIETFDESVKKGFCPFCDTYIKNVSELQGKFEEKIKKLAEKNKANSKSKVIKVKKEKNSQDEKDNKYEELLGEIKVFVGDDLSIGTILENKKLIRELNSLCKKLSAYEKTTILSKLIPFYFNTFDTAKVIELHSFTPQQVSELYRFSPTLFRRLMYDFFDQELRNNGIYNNLFDFLDELLKINKEIRESIFGNIRQFIDVINAYRNPDSKYRVTFYPFLNPESRIDCERDEEINSNLRRYASLYRLSLPLLKVYNKGFFNTVTWFEY